MLLLGIKSHLELHLGTLMGDGREGARGRDAFVLLLEMRVQSRVAQVGFN